MFITFEGIDGTGKSTLVYKVRDTLFSLGYKVIVSRAPGGTQIGSILRNIVLNPNYNTHPEVRALLFLADQIQLCDELLHLSKTNIILCDRFKDSTYIYQIITSNLSLDFKNQIRTHLERIPDPDLTFILDLDVAIAKTRLKTQEFRVKDTYEREAKWEERRIAHLNLPITFPNRNYLMLDASKSLEELTSIVINTLSNKFNLRGQHENIIRDMEGTEEN